MNLILKQFPDSDYAKDVVAKIHYARTALAERDMEVGRGYQKNGSMVAAINRFRAVLHYYPDTMLVQEALYRILWSYLNLGLRSQAENYLILLENNYRDGDFCKLARNAVAHFDDAKKMGEMEKLRKTNL